MPPMEDSWLRALCCTADRIGYRNPCCRSAVELIGSTRDHKHVDNRQCAVCLFVPGVEGRAVRASREVAVRAVKPAH